MLRYLIAGLAMTLLARGVAIAADPPSADPVLTEATEFPGYAMFAESGAPGMVLAVVRGESSVVLGYGETERGNGQAPDGRSLFPVNSIAKVFATEVLASLTAKGRVRLTDTLQQHAGGMHVPPAGTAPDHPP